MTHTKHTSLLHHALIRTRFSSSSLTSGVPLEHCDQPAAAPGGGALLRLRERLPRTAARGAGLRGRLHGVDGLRRVAAGRSGGRAARQGTLQGAIPYALVPALYLWGPADRSVCLLAMNLSKAVHGTEVRTPPACLFVHTSLTIFSVFFDRIQRTGFRLPL